MSKSNVGYNMLKCLFGSVSYKFHLKLILALKTQASELALNFAHHRTWIFISFEIALEQMPLIA
jgi:ABC-type uncharacterized transport system permease subunit